MSTRSSAKNLFPPLDNPELTIRRRSHSDPTLLNNSEMAAEGPGDLPDTSAQQSESSSSITSSSDTEIAALKAKIAKINKNLMRVLQVNQQVKAVTPNCKTCGGRHSFSNCPAIVGNTQNVYAAGAYQGPPGFYQNQIQNNQNHNFQNQNRNQGNHHLQGNNHGRNQFFQGANQGQNQPLAYQAPAYQTLVYQASVLQPQIPQPQIVTTNEFTNFMKANDLILKNMQTNMTSLTNINLELKNMFGQFMKMNTASSSGSGTLPGNTITNPKEDLKGITTRSGTAYPRPTIPTTSSSLVVERETEATKDTVHPINNGSTKDVQPSVVPTESPILNSEPVNSPIIEPVASLVSAPKPNLRPLIPYPSRLQDQKLRYKANDQREKFFQIFKVLNFNISFADTLILMAKFGPSIKSLLTNMDKLYELTRTPVNEHCLAVLLKKFPEKLGDPGKFLIPFDFPGTDECLALADLGASINLMPLSVWNKLSLPDLSPMCMTLELSDRSISHPVGVAEDVFVKVGTFHFPADFVVVNFDADTRVPLILGRSFVKTERALIDVFKGELSLHVGKEAITFNHDQTLRYSANYNYITAKRIDVIDMACEEYSQEVLGFSNMIASGNPTPYYDPIVSTTSPTLIPFENSDFLLEEVDAFLALEDDPTSPKVNQSYLDTEGDILLLEAFLNDDPSLPPPNQGNYLPEEKTTFTCTYGIFAYLCMPFGLCNAPDTFQRCMMAIFHDMIEKTMEVFTDDFSVFGNSFQSGLSHLEKMFECSSCGALYTGDFCCSKGNVEDKILVPKLLKNYARCGHPVDGPYCQGCSLLQKKLKEDLVTYFQDFQNTSESSDDSTNVVNAPREPFVVKQDHGVKPPYIDECCCECGDVLDGIFVNNALVSLVGKEDMQELFRKLFNDVQNTHEELAEYINTPGWNRPAFYNNGDDDDVDYTIAITPVLSTEEPDNSLSMEDEHLDTIPATKLDKVIKSSVEDLILIPSESESNDDSLYNENIECVEASPHDSELISLEVADIVIPKDEEIEDDNLREKLLNVNFLIAKFEALKDNPTLSFEFLTKSSSTSPKFFLEETNTFDNSLPEFENFCFDLEEISSGSTTTHSDISLPNYEAFYFDDDHIKEISSGSTTTHSDIFLFEYDSFIFDLSNDQFPPTDRSYFAHEEFTDELAHIISPPEYDCFYFRNLPNPGKWIPILNSEICENLSSTTRINLPVEDDHSPLLAYVVWIFLAYLTDDEFIRQDIRGLFYGRFSFYDPNVTNKQEKDKIETKPDQIKKKQEAWEKPGSVEDQSQSRKQKREENTKSRDQYWKFLEVVLIQ
nr:reverse transcriptase domain-containing protein [Tanacetum cinerariifolium]